MILYISIACYLFVLVFLYDFGNNKKGKNVAFRISFILLWLYSGLRYRVGTDSFMYETIFDYLPPITKLSTTDFLLFYDIEPLWIILNSLIKTVWNNFVALELFCAFVLNYSFFNFVKKHTNYQFTAILIYFLIDYLILNCEYMRQATAVALYMAFVCPLYEQKKYIVWFLGTLILCFMHNTMYICFFIPIIDRLNFSNQKAIYYWIACFIIISNIDVFKILAGLSVGVSSTSYKIEAYSRETRATIYNINFLISKLYVIFLLIYLFGLKIEFKYKNIIILYGFSIVLTSVHGIFYRFQFVVSFYYLLFYACCIADTLLYKKQQIKAIIIFVATILPTATTLMHRYDNGLYNYQKYFPYYSYFNPRKDKHREKLKAYDEFEKMLDRR